MNLNKLRMRAAHSVLKSFMQEGVLTVNTASASTGETVLRTVFYPSGDMLLYADSEFFEESCQQKERTALMETHRQSVRREFGGLEAVYYLLRAVASALVVIPIVLLAVFNWTFWIQEHPLTAVLDLLIIGLSGAAYARLWRFFLKSSFKILFRNLKGGNSLFKLLVPGFR